MFQLYWVIKIFFFTPLFQVKLLRNNGVYCFDDDGGDDGDTDDGGDGGDDGGTDDDDDGGDDGGTDDGGDGGDDKGDDDEEEEDDDSCHVLAAYPAQASCQAFIIPKTSL